MIEYAKRKLGYYGYAGMIYDIIDALLVYAEKNLYLHKKNVDYARNGIFRLLGLDAYSESERGADEVLDKTPERLLDELTSACLSEGLFEAQEAEYYRDAVMGELMLSPKDVQDIFEKKREKEGSEAALGWFYDYSVKGDYVKKAVLDKNPRFSSQGLIITINKAKPEFRDPKKAVSGNSTKTGYPKCNICHENEGFAGISLSVGNRGSGSTRLMGISISTALRSITCIRRCT